MIAALAGRGASSSSSAGGMTGALGGSLGSVAGDLLGVKRSGPLFVDMLDPRQFRTISLGGSIYVSFITTATGKRLARTWRSAPM